MYGKKSLAILALSLVSFLSLASCNDDTSSSSHVSSSNVSDSISSSSSPKGDTPTTSSSSSSSSMNNQDSTNSHTTSSQSTTHQKPDGAVDLKFGEQSSDGNQNPTTPLEDNVMMYWNDQGWLQSTVTVNYAYSYQEAYYISYTTTGTSQYGSNFQLFYKNTTLDYSKKWAVSFKLTTNTGGTIRVNQKEKTLVVGENNISAEVIHKEGNYANLEIITGTYNNNTPTQIDAMDFVIKELKWEESKELKAPTFSVSKSDQGKYKVNITSVEGASKYEGILVEKESNEEVTPFEIKNDEELDLSNLTSNKAYKLFLRSIGDGVTTETSPWSETYEIVNNGTISMQAPTTETNLAFGEEAKQPLNTYYYWNDQNWTGSNVTISKAVVQGQTASFNYSVTSGSCDFGFQIFYKNTNNVNGKKYTLSFTLSSNLAGTIKVKGDSEVEKTIQANDNNQISIKYTEVNANASLHIIVPTSLGTPGELKVINPTWTPVA